MSQLKLQKIFKDENPFEKLLFERFNNKIPEVDEILTFCTENKCSDLYIKVGKKPYISKYGKIYEVPTFELTMKIWQDWAKLAISSENNAKYVRQKMLDFSYSIIPKNSNDQSNIDSEPVEYRYRVSAGFSLGKNIATFRMISKELPSFNSIKFPKDIIDILKDVGQKRNKITMFVGVTGSGKSVIYNQQLQVTNFTFKEFKTITWEDLKTHNFFPDGSEVIEIAPWEYRPCYKLTIGESSIVVSDEHLLKCYFGEKIIPRTFFDGEFIEYWASAKDIFNYKTLSGSEIFMYDSCNNTWNKLDNIELYDNGFPQKCRCIKTSTGHYQIGKFTNHNTTTMAACINDFSKQDGPFHDSVMISLEDPIEYIYPNTDNVNILQKELGSDFKEFSLGVKQALREHPNFINVGETRDKETINTLIEASRTGHAVYTSFHASDVADTISRLYNYLIADNQDVMYDLISNLNLIICQKLLPQGNSFKLLTQYMVFTDQIIQYLNNMIEQGKNIPNVINALFKNEELIKHKIVKNWS